MKVIRQDNSKLYLFTEEEYNDIVIELVGRYDPIPIRTTKYRSVLDEVSSKHIKLEIESYLDCDIRLRYRSFLLYEGDILLCTRNKYDIDDIYKYVIIERLD